MSTDPPTVASDKLPDLVRQIIAEVLMVPREQVRPDSALIADLGAESLDFLDLLFRLEEALGKKMPPDRWDEFARTKAPEGDFGTVITTDVMLEFARRESKRDSERE